MKLIFRWYGERDVIPLAHIKQIPNMSGVVTAVYDSPVGQAWSGEHVARLRELTRVAGLEMEVIESVPVHEDIKLGLPTREPYIENYRKTVEVLGANGVKCVCYNFMPVFDWVRTTLALKNGDGSNSLAFFDEQIDALDPQNLRLPGWDESYTPGELRALLAAYKDMTHGRLFENLRYFLSKILPTCERVGVNMAIHPDDPPWDIFGLPRIMCREDDIDRLFAALPSERNGITFCTGSLGADRKNDLPKMAAKYAAAGRIKFAHLRNIEYIGKSGFRESAHPTSCGSLPMREVVRALVKHGFDGYVRPDHGRNIWGERGKPGYGLYDRALGAAYLNGLFEGVSLD